MAIQVALMSNEVLITFILLTLEDLRLPVSEGIARAKKLQRTLFLREFSILTIDA
jgi:hypothetical protein